MNLVLDRIEKSWISINWVVEYLLGTDTLPTYLKNCIKTQKLEKIGLREHGYARYLLTVLKSAQNRRKSQN